MRPYAPIFSSYPTFYHSFIYLFFVHLYKSSNLCRCWCVVATQVLLPGGTRRSKKGSTSCGPIISSWRGGQRDGSGGVKGRRGAEAHLRSSSDADDAVANCFNRIKRHHSSHHRHHCSPSRPPPTPHSLPWGASTDFFHCFLIRFSFLILLLWSCSTKLVNEKNRKLIVRKKKTFVNFWFYC